MPPHDIEYSRATARAPVVRGGRAGRHLPWSGPAGFAITARPRAGSPVEEVPPEMVRGLHVPDFARSAPRRPLRPTSPAPPQVARSAPRRPLRPTSPAPPHVARSAPGRPLRPTSPAPPHVARSAPRRPLRPRSPAPPHRKHLLMSWQRLPAPAVTPPTRSSNCAGSSTRRCDNPIRSRSSEPARPESCPRCRS